MASDFSLPRSRPPEPREVLSYPTRTERRRFIDGLAFHHLVAWPVSVEHIYEAEEKRLQRDIAYDPHFGHYQERLDAFSQWVAWEKYLALERLSRWNFGYPIAPEHSDRFRRQWTDQWNTKAMWGQSMEAYFGNGRLINPAITMQALERIHARLSDYLSPHSRLPTLRDLWLQSPREPPPPDPNSSNNRWVQAPMNPNSANNQGVNPPTSSQNIFAVGVQGAEIPLNPLSVEECKKEWERCKEGIYILLQSAIIEGTGLFQSAHLDVLFEFVVAQQRWLPEPASLAMALGMIAKMQDEPDSCLLGFRFLKGILSRGGNFHRAQEVADAERQWMDIARAKAATPQSRRRPRRAKGP